MIDKIGDQDKQSSVRSHELASLIRTWSAHLHTGPRHVKRRNCKA
ncbi:hypothetical protein [Sinorhizobium alkalisoli]|nr:hypothetical protein [Sinorhizobium alkalisoli]